MSLFDKLFDNKKTNKVDAAMEGAFQNFIENNPIMKKARATIEEAGDNITTSLEEELYGEAKSDPSAKGSVMEHFEERSREWDAMFDQIVDKDLGMYKICPECGEAAPSDLEECPNCGARLPEHTAAVKICPHCGAENKALDFYCTNCGKEFTLS